MGLQTLATLILFLPLCAVILGNMVVYGLPQNDRASLVQWLTSFTMMASAFLSLILFNSIGVQEITPVSHEFFTWLELGSIYVPFGLYVDKLGATMMLVVTAVSACVHLYAMGFMSEDPDKQRFFSYLSLLTFAMLLLVSAPNLLQLFIGWQGVAVCSYLLINFWHHKLSANAAALKALLMNFVADAFLLVALFIILGVFGTLTYIEFLPQVSQYTDATFSFLGQDWRVLDAAALTLFISAMGKSAQFGLHMWLSDATEAPTPAAALIQSTTTAAAGIFLLCRMSPLLEAAPSILHLAAWVGVFTALFAATVGLTQKNTKRVLSYSTSAQLGYMCFAIGLSAYSVAVFHLVMHAFFKTILFLCAGSVIHALHNEQNLFKMGGMRHILPITYALMWLGSLSLMGIPPFAGFLSQNTLMTTAFSLNSNAGYALYAFGIFAGLLTAFYTCRVIFLAFHGAFKGDEHDEAYAHKNPQIMVVSMVVLALCSVCTAHFLQLLLSQGWWQGVLTATAHSNSQDVAILWAFLPVGLSLSGIALAAFLYLKKPEWPARIAEHNDLLYKFSLNKWYMNELYQAVIIHPAVQLARWLHRTLDARLIDGILIQGSATLIMKVSHALGNLHAKYKYHAVFIALMALGLFVVYPLLMEGSR